MSFGWSVGDILAAISLVIDIAESLREVGGAKSDYQATINSLEGLLSALQFIDQAGTVPQGAKTPQTDQSKKLTQTQVDLIKQPVQDFVTEVKPKYGKYMNKDSKTWSLGLYGAHRKVKWTKWIAKKVDSLKNQIAVPLETLQILAGADIKTTLSDMRQSLPSETSASVLKMLSDSGLKVSSSSVGPWVLMPYTRNLAYILREKPFDQLKVLLNIHDSPASANQNKRAALWGLGGTGKTQIAIHYAYWLLVQEPKTSIFWVHASSEARFQESFDQIGKMLGVPGLEDPSQDSKLLVRKKLMTVAVGPWLMIVDNADDNDLMYSGPNLARYLPTCSHGRIVATTRDREIAISMATIRGAIEIPKMEPNECEQLVNIILSTTDFDEKDKEDAKRLGQILGYLPLAISQAAAYIEVKSLDIHTYLQIYEQKKIEMLSTKFESPGREDSEVPNAVVATWKLSLESIQGKDPRAVDMLSLMAFYDRQGIPGTLLQEGIGDLSTFVEPRSILINFSLIKCNKKADTYEIHRLVHMVIRSWVHEQGQSKEDNIAKHALKIVNSAFPEDILDKWVDCVPLVPHGRAVLQYKSTFLSSDQALERASLLHKMAKYLLEAGEYSAARDMEEEAMNLRTAQCGTKHPATLACMRNLALIYQRQGHNDEAERLLVQDAETMIRLFGWEDKETLASLAQLAQLCLATNRPYAASRLFSKVIHAPSAGGGQSKMDPRRRLRILLDLATSYASEGRLRAAEESILKVMEELKIAHRISDFESIRAMVDLAGVYAAQDKWDVAENLWTSATLSNQLSSVAHPLAFHAMSCLGRAYSLNNRLKEGEALQVKVLLWSKATFGSAHVETQRAAKDLAQTYYRSGQGTLAKNLELEILKAGAETFKDIPVGWEGRSFDSLVLPLEHKRILRSLMVCDLELLKRASSGLLSRDSIIILLHGPPGSGKTTTAYALAEFSKKPLVPLLWGNIGLPIREIEDNLEFYARLSRNHKCILFLDNGDALVSFKSRGNPYLSQINSACLGALNAISGPLIITTNRVGRFDDAILCQLDIFLLFPQFGVDLTLHIWKKHLEEIKYSMEAELRKVVIEEMSILEFASEMYQKQRVQQRRQLNGSQIRNLFAIALASAKYEYTSKDKVNILESGEYGEYIVLDKGVFERAASSSLNIDDFMLAEIWTESSYSTSSSLQDHAEKNVNLIQDRFLDEDDSLDELETDNLAFGNLTDEGSTLQDFPAEDRPLDASQAKYEFVSRLAVLPSWIRVEENELNSIVGYFSNHWHPWPRTSTLRGIDKTIRLVIIIAMHAAMSETERDYGTKQNSVDNIALKKYHFEVALSMEEKFWSDLGWTWGGDKEQRPERITQLGVRTDNYPEVGRTSPQTIG